MNIPLIHDDMVQFLQNVADLDFEAQCAAFAKEAEKTNGSITCPADDKSGRASHLCEIRLHGVEATGGDLQEAMQNWKDAAAYLTPVIDAEALGLLNPQPMSQERARCL